MSNDRSQHPTRQIEFDPSWYQQVQDSEHYLPIGLYQWGIGHLLSNQTAIGVWAYESPSSYDLTLYQFQVTKRDVFSHDGKGGPKVRFDDTMYLRMSLPDGKACIMDQTTAFISPGPNFTNGQAIACFHRYLVNQEPAWRETWSMRKIWRDTKFLIPTTKEVLWRRMQREVDQFCRNCEDLPFPDPQKSVRTELAFRRWNFQLRPYTPVGRTHPDDRKPPSAEEIALYEYICGLTSDISYEGMLSKSIQIFAGS